MVSNSGNGIYWRIITAIAGLILLGASPPTKQAPNGTTASKETPAKPVSPVSDKYKPYADKYAEACYNADNHDSADLCAQWRAAIAAEKSADATTWANWISTGGALLSFVSIVLVIVALGQTRKANRLTMKANVRSTRQAIASAADTAKALAIAKRNANAADAQVRNSEKTARRQLRAYMMIDHCTIEMLENNEGFILQATLKNCGVTPAYNAGIMGESFGDIYPMTEERPFLDREEGYTAPVGPGQTITAAYRILTEDALVTLAETKREQIGLYIQGVCGYSDIFGSKHTTKFRYVFGGRVSDLGLVMHAAETGNEAT